MIVVRELYQLFEFFSHRTQKIPHFHMVVRKCIDGQFVILQGPCININSRYINCLTFSYFSLGVPYVCI